jgi:hypothetical protein
MIKYYCPHCSQKLGVPDNYAGHRVRCNKCKEPSLVPDPAPEGLERIDESPALTATAHSSASRPPAASVSRTSTPTPSEPDYMETGPDPMALAAARSAWDRKHAKALLQSTGSGGGPSEMPTFGLSNIPLAARIPLALATSAVFALAVGAAWAAVAALTGWIFGIFAFVAAAAAAAGITMYTAHRNAVLGVLAVIVGFGGILCGKYLVGQWAVLPWIYRDCEEASARGYVFMGQDDMNAFLSNDERMLSIACVSLIGSQQVDEAKGKLFIIEQQTDGLEPSYLSDAELAEMRQKTAAERDSWNDNQKQNAIKQYAPYVDYTMYKNSKSGRAFASRVAFASTFGFWDLIMIPMALGVAFKAGAGRK